MTTWSALENEPWSWARPDRDQRLPYVMRDPPGMSAADVDLYRGNAYGTPHESHIKGPAEAAAFAYSLRSPALHYGLDLTKVSEVPADSEDAATAARSAGGPVFGFYDPNRDRGVSIANPHTSPGSILTHEALHRAYEKLRRDIRSSVPDEPPRADSSRRQLWVAGRVLGDDSRMDHQLIDVEEAMIGGTGRTRMVDPSAAAGVYTEDGGRAGRGQIEFLARAIEQLRRERGDFSRMGPR